MYQMEIAQPLLGRLESSDYPAFAGLETSDFPAFKGKYVRIEPQPVFGQANGNGRTAQTAIVLGAAGLVVSAAVSFALMVGAAYLGARWAGCRR